MLRVVKSLFLCILLNENYCLKAKLMETDNNSVTFLLGVRLKLMFDRFALPLLVALLKKTNKNHGKIYSYLK